MKIEHIKAFSERVVCKFKPRRKPSKIIGGLPHFESQNEALIQFIIKCEYELGFFDIKETENQFNLCIQQIENKFPNLESEKSLEAVFLHKFKEEIKNINACLDENYSPMEIRELLNLYPIEKIENHQYI